ncbi:MAG TPA: DUF1638 domain-containing protein [Candidatus Nanoarchaeia archaeon]|nr:DUF1638 domain-containing protein [Candidatus Nanoarchaeia archaeon]
MTSSIKAEDAKTKPCLISCSVLKSEIDRLQRHGDMDIDVIYVSKMFHVDYKLLEKNLRKTIERTLSKASEKPILVYGDLCLGPNDEMKQLAQEYGLAKINALNCVDCLLGGRGKIDEVDPHHELMFFDPGMIEFFRLAKKKLMQEGMDEEALRNMFNGIKGIVLLDTLGRAEKCIDEIKNLNTGLPILEIKKVGLENLKQVLTESIEQAASRKDNL